MKSRHLLRSLIVLLLAAFITTRAAAEDRGAYSLVPVGARTFVLEAIDAGTAEGKAIALEKDKATDPHLQSLIRPLAGSGTSDAKLDGATVYQPPTIKPQDVLPGETKQFRFTTSKV